MARVNSLSRQLLLKVMSFSLALALLLTLVNGWLTFRHETQRQNQELQTILTAYSGGFAKAVWEIDRESIRVQLAGLSHFEAILSAQVEADGDRHSYVKQGGHLDQAAAWLSYPLLAPDGRTVIGTWKLRLDQEALYQKVRHTMGIFMLLVVLELLLQALLIYGLVNRSVSLPIKALAKHIGTLKTHGLTLAVPRWADRQPNELHQLAQGIEQLQSNLHNELLHRDLTSRGLALREQQLLRISKSASIDEGDLVKTYALVTSAACAGLGVQRSSIWFWQTDRSAIACTMLWDQHQGLMAKPANLRQQDFPRYFDALQEGRAILAHDANTDPRTAELAQPYLQPLGIFSLLDVGIWHGGQLVGVLCCEHAAAPRSWREEEGVFAAALADLISRAMTAHSRVNAEVDLKNLLVTLENRVAERTRQLEVSNLNLETFAFSVSHDLKAPLRGVDGYSRLLESEYAEHLPEEAKSFVLKIRTASQRMHDLIEDLLAYSRVGRRPLSASTFSSQTSIQRVLNEFDHDLKHAHIDLVNHCGDIQLALDVECFMQIMRNLIGNAIKFTGAVDHPMIELSSQQRHDHVVFCVKDNGCGFDMKYHDRIFSLFQRLHTVEEYPGTGVGLAIVTKAAERLGGRVWATSMLGQGTSFFVELPTKPPTVGG